MKIAIVAGKFNKRITEGLIKGANRALEAQNVSDVEEFWVPGAFELPLACKWLSKKFQGIVALGAVIRGETSHYDQVANAASSGIAEVSRNEQVPIGFGVITAENVEQAVARSSDNDENVGFRAAIAMIEMIEMKEKTEKS